MIKKIQNSEYLRRYDNMNACERSAYKKRVGEWLRNQASVLIAEKDDFDARLQNVVVMSSRWSDVTCQAFEEGAKLLSALTNRCETWLPEQLYTKSAARCLKQMVKLLTEFAEGKEADGKQADGESQQGKTVTMTPISKSDGKSDAKTEGETGANLTPLNSQPSTPNIPRPKHIDQYINLLPESLQKEAAQVGQMLRDLDTARENAQKLMDEGITGEKISYWARTARDLDDNLKKIYNKLDEEWLKLVLTRKVAVDDFGVAYVVSEEGKVNSEEGNTQERTEQQDPEAEKQEAVPKLRKWLIDTRNAVSEKQTEKWTAKYREMVTLGGMESVTDKVREAAKHYGIDLASLEVKSDEGTVKNEK